MMGPLYDFINDYYANKTMSVVVARPPAVPPVSHKEAISRARLVPLIGTLSAWHHLTQDGDFSQWDELHTYLLDSIIASETFTARILLIREEADFVLAQAKEWCADIKRETL